ncbi:DUF7006 family protein [Enterococcus faecium]|uniref:DUF7006 family protein n=1 Tax=Enterococcus faecium TaxID=1352 RepID=UPI0010FBCCDF|nr:hypothetical protein [Enterococcus faecium]QCS45675.1 hypothetical protein FEF08_03190 [Enterococcus faecium]
MDEKSRVETYLDEESYIEKFKEMIHIKKNMKRYPIIVENIQMLLQEINQLVVSVNEKNFFFVMSNMLGIDAKLQILSFFLEEQDETISEREIMSICENDYKSYFKEICGYNLMETSPNSLHFFVT